MSGVRHNGSWRRIQSIKQKVAGVWQEHSAIYGRHENAWFPVDLSAEPLDPAYHVWILYADNPYASTFAGKGISLDSTDKNWVGFLPGKRKKTPIMGVDIVDDDDLVGINWSQLGGTDARLYYISSPQGTAIKNGVGTLNLRVHYVEGGNNTVLLDDGPFVDPQFYVGATPLGRSPSFTATDINENLLVELRRNGELLDSVNLIDVADGSAATQIGFDALGPMQWTKEPNGGAWSPVALTSQYVFTFYRSGATILERTVDITLDPDTGLLTAFVNPIADPPEATTVTVDGAGTTNLVITATHNDSGASYTETVGSVRGGDKGETGSSYRQLTIYRRSPTTLTNADIPNDGSFNFGTNEFTPPTGWGSAIPAGTDPVYSATAVAFSATSVGTVGDLVWTEPEVALQNGGVGEAGVSVYTTTLYQRAAAKPAKPTAASEYNFGTNSFTQLPPGWSDTAPDNDGNPLWGTQVTFKAPGATGSDTSTVYSDVKQTVADGNPGYSYHTYQVYARAVTAPAKPTGGEFNFSTNAVTPPGGDVTWYDKPPEGDDPLYASLTTARIAGDTGIDNSLTYSDPYLLVRHGENGLTGFNTATIHLYQRSADVPLPNTVDLTYEFDNKTLLGTPDNGWVKSIDATTGTDPLYVQTASALSRETTDVIDNLEWTAPALLSVNGETGEHGQNTATVFLFKRTDNPLPNPTGPSTALTYNFAAKTLTGDLEGWTRTLPATGGKYRWVITATAASAEATDEIPPGEWAAATILAQDGDDGVGADGYNTAVLYLYARGNTAPTFPTTTDLAYNFDTKTLASPPSPWKRTVGELGATGATIWTIAATASNRESTDTIDGNEWSAPVQLGTPGDDGAPGINAATLYAFKRNTGGAPGQPTNNVTYTFATKSLSGPLGNEWYTTAPTTGGDYLWVTTATAASANSTDSINATEWATAAILGQKGAPGEKGDKGDEGPRGFTGPNGSNGAGWWKSKADAQANGRQLVEGDIAIEGGVAQRYNGSEWVTTSTFIKGGMIVDGTISGRHIEAGSIDADRIKVSELDVTQANWGPYVSINAGGVPTGNGSAEAFISVTAHTSVGVGLYCDVINGAGVSVRAQGSSNGVYVNHLGTGNGILVAGGNGDSVAIYGGNRALYIGSSASTGIKIDVSGLAIDAVGDIHCDVLEANDVLINGSRPATKDANGRVYDSVRLEGARKDTAATTNTIVQRQGDGDISVVDVHCRYVWANTPLTGIASGDYLLFTRNVSDAVRMVTRDSFYAWIQGLIQQEIGGYITDHVDTYHSGGSGF